MENNPIERFGGLLKEESLSCIENEILLKDTCVIESVSPFAGYFMQIPGTNKPNYLYLMLDGRHTVEQILRAAAAIRKKVKFDFDAVAGEIVFPGMPACPAIRIRNLDQYDQIAELQKQFKSEGIQLKKKSRHIENLSGLIRLEKLFFLKPIENQMYFDLHQLHHGYFVVPKNISWKKFVVLTTTVKFETSLLYFDAAQAFIFEGDKLIDLVRIYIEDLTIEKLQAIQMRYLKLFDQFAD